MRVVLLVVLLCAQTVLGADLRVLGTNLYNFSALGRIPPDKEDPNILDGTVTGVVANGVTIKWTTVEIALDVPKEDLLTATTNELLQMTAAEDAMKEGMTPRKWMALSPDIRRYFKRVEHYHTATVLNAPQTAVGEHLRVSALPVETALSTWDCGRPIEAGQATNFTTVCMVYPHGEVFRIKYGPPVIENGVAMSPNVRQRIERATAGEASEQYDLAIDYLRGYGIAVDEKKGLVWMKKAADQDFEPAKNYLRTNTPPAK
jgi:hypothetical protein